MRQFSGYEFVSYEKALRTGRRILEETGYLAVRQAIPRATVGSVFQRVADGLRRAQWCVDESAGPPRANVDVLHQLDAQRYHAVFADIWSEIAIHRLPHHPRLTTLMTSLLGIDITELLVHPQNVLRLQWPDPGAVAGRHQDFVELQGSLTQLTTWLPLHPVGPAGGALPLYPRSHQDGVRELVLDSNTPGNWACVVDGLTDCHVGQIDVGDVLIFTTLTVHGGAQCDASAFRLSMDFRYQPVHEPLCEMNLKLPGYPYDWDHLYQNWARDEPLKYYWQRYPLQLVAFDPRWENWRDVQRRSLRQQWTA